MIGEEEEQIASERSRADPDPDFVAKAAISRISASVASLQQQDPSKKTMHHLGCITFGHCTIG